MTINTESLGTPAESYRRQCARRERIYFRLFVAGIFLSAVGCAFLAGLHARNAEQPGRAGEHYRSLAARLPEGGRRCEVEPHEGCLVCMSRIDGQPVVSTHC